MIVRFENTIEGYRKFLRVRRCPIYHFRGHQAIVPDEYQEYIDGKSEDIGERQSSEIDHHADAYDYQRDITARAVASRKFAIFADCGLGKTLMELEFAKHAFEQEGQPVLIVAPLMVCRQTVEEALNFYGADFPIMRVKAAELQDWLNNGDGIGITNYEAIREDITIGNCCGLILDESSMLKSHYGAWGTRLIEMGRGLRWKLCCTGTPAPNDRIEYANHAVFLDAARNVNEFLATYFINRGQTQNRWEIKSHALGPFYRSLATWSIFLTNPSTYGWKDNVGTIPPIHVHIDSVPMTAEQVKAAQDVTGTLLATHSGGIGQRSKLSQIAKGKNGIKTLKYDAIKSIVDENPDDSVIIWCHYNDEQERLERTFPEAVSISGSTKESDREIGIDRFKSGDARVLITKPKILGFGLNLQICTRQIFSGIKDSYEEYYQAVKRSNRIGSTKPLNVHIPVTDIEVQFVDNVLRKAKMVESDTAKQEELFNAARI